MSSQILDIHFLNRTRTAIELDVLTLQQFYQPRSIHSMTAAQMTAAQMTAAQRVHFNLAMLFTHGEGIHTVDFQPHLYQKQTLLFVAANQVQQFHINPTSDAFMILFTRAFLYQGQEDQPILQHCRILDASLQSPRLQLKDDDYQRFLSLFKEILREYKTTQSAQLQQDLLRDILLRAEHLKQTESTPGTLAAYPEFIRFKDKVEQDFAQTHNVKDYAIKLGVTPKLLNQWTQTVVNKPAKTFVDDRVILEIKRLLTHTDLPIKIIAEQTGFDEPTNLIKFYKQRCGQTPALFRSQSR